MNISLNSPTKVEITFLQLKKTYYLKYFEKEYILDNKLLSISINDELKFIFNNIINDLKTGSAKFFTK